MNGNISKEHPWGQDTPCSVLRPDRDSLLETNEVGSSPTD